MASAVNLDGVQVDPGRKERVDPERAKDLAVIGMKARGYTFRQIGKIMGVSQVAIFKRWHAIPTNVREFYGRRSLG